MRVTVASWGRFHFFDLARELDALGALDELVTSYPPFVTGRFGVRTNKVRGSYTLEPIARLYLRSGGRRDGRLMRELRTAWERNLIRKLKASAVFVGLSGFCVEALTEARKRGSVAILERSSSHIRTQARLLREEQELSGYHVEQVSAFDVEREEAGYQAADYVLVPSTFCEQSFLNEGFPRKKVLKNALGVNIDGFKPRPDRRPGRPGTPLRVINVGAFSIRKGMHYLVQAAKSLARNEFEFVHVGPIGDSGGLLSELPANFVHHGPVSQSDLWKYYAQADVFVLPTIEDGFPTVIPQAMACGLPVVTTRHGSGPDIVQDGENGFLIPIRNVDAIVERLSDLSKDRVKCFEMGRNARRTVEVGFSWPDYGKRSLQLYESVLSQR